MNKKVIIGILVGLLVFCICCLACGGLTYVIINQAEEDSKPKTYTQNQTVELKEVEWKVKDAQDLGNTLDGADSKYKTRYYTPDDKKANGRYVQVTFTITNKDKESLSFSASKVKLIDEDEYEYSYATDVSAWIPKDEDNFYEQINPNSSITTTLIYDIPDNVDKLMVKATNFEYILEKEAYIELDI